MIRQLIFIGLLLIGFVGNSYSQDYIDEHTVNGLSASHKYTYDYFIRAIGSEPDSLTGDGYLYFGKNFFYVGGGYELGDEISFSFYYLCEPGLRFMEKVEIGDPVFKLKEVGIDVVGTERRKWQFEAIYSCYEPWIRYDEFGNILWISYDTDVP